MSKSQYAGLAKSPARTEMAVAHLSEADFRRMKAVAGSVAFERYDDWIEDRVGFEVGLSAAGVRVVSLIVDLDDMLGWCAAHAKRIDWSAVDRYATHLLERSTPEERRERELPSNLRRFWLERSDAVNQRLH